MATRGESLVKVMDEAARRVLSGAERAYDIAAETSAELVHLDPDSSSIGSWSAQVLWLEITDIVDFLDGPATEDLCEELAREFSRSWLALADRQDESAQQAFMAAFDLAFDKRLSEFRAAHS